MPYGARLVRKISVHDERLNALMRRVHQFTARYGTVPELERLAGLDRAVNVRTRAIGNLQRCIREIEDEIADLHTEIAGLANGYKLVLEEIVAELEEKFVEGWSPTMIIGYRTWGIDDGRVSGFFSTWESGTFEAVCGRNAPGEIPHTDGRCGSPPCGIYAVKEPRAVDLDTFKEGDGTAIGCVGLYGKVVEHEHGYRAAKATVLALAAECAGKVLTTCDHDDINRFFAAPTIAIDVLGTAAAGRDEQRRQMLEHITNAIREGES